MDDFLTTSRLKVFLSHSSADKDLARQLAHDLRLAKIDVWLDQWEILVGDDFAQTITRGVDDADFLVILLTRDSVASGWVDREWRQKLEEEARTNRIAIVPVRADRGENAEPWEIPDFLAQRSYADISRGSYPLGFTRLLEILGHYSNRTGIDVPANAIGKDDPSVPMYWCVVPTVLEVNRDLIPIMEPDVEGNSRFLTELVPRMLEELRTELGVPFPGIRVCGNEADMPLGSALIMIDEIPEIMLWDLGLEDVFVNETVDRLGKLGINGEPRDDLAAGRARARIAAADRAAAEDAGLMTWDSAEFLISVLKEVLRQHASVFLDIDVTWRLVDAIERSAPELVADTVPKRVSWIELTEVLQFVVSEEIGIGDLGRILEAMRRCEPGVKDTALLAESARHALSGQITAQFARDQRAIAVLPLDPEIELQLSAAIQPGPIGPYLASNSQLAQDILIAVREQLTTLDDMDVGAPLLVSNANVRRFVRRLVKLEFPWLHVLSRQDLDPETQIEEIAWIRLGSADQNDAGGSE